MSSRGMTIGEVLEQVKPGYNRESASAFAPAEDGSDEHRPPWFVRALVAVSAWIASLLFLTFLGASSIIRSSGAAMVLGAVFIVAAVVIRRSQGRVLFLVQLSLALSLAGQALLLFGIGDKSRSADTVAFIAVILSAALIIVYQDRTHRFLSTLIAVGAVFSLVYIHHIAYGIQILAAGLACAAGFILYEESRLTSFGLDALLRPVGYGLVVGMFFMLIPSVIPPEFRTRFGLAQNWLPATAALTALLGYFEFRILAFHNASRNIRTILFLVLGTAGLFLASFRAPGIIAALYMLVLGFHRANRLVMGLSIAFLVVFLSAFYYNLDITLLNKSYVLLGSGGLLIALRLVLPVIIPEASHE